MTLLEIAFSRELGWVECARCKFANWGAGRWVSRVKMLIFVYICLYIWICIFICVFVFSFVHLYLCICKLRSRRVSEGVEDAYTGADSQALKRTGTQTSRQGVYKDIIPHNKQTDEAALKNGIIRWVSKRRTKGHWKLRYDVNQRSEKKVNGADERVEGNKQKKQKKDRIAENWRK